MTKTFAINWMTFNGNWRATPGPLYPSRAAAMASLRKLGLAANPAYRVVEVCDGLLSS
jgi:hypothetical protein